MSRYVHLSACVIPYNTYMSAGIMRMSTYVLIAVAPINLALNVFFVHYTPLGLLGAPLAISITFWLCFFLLILLTYLSPTHRSNGTWAGFQFGTILDFSSSVYFLKLAIPGILMVGTEWCVMTSSHASLHLTMVHQGGIRDCSACRGAPWFSSSGRAVCDHDNRPECVLIYPRIRPPVNLI